MTIGLPTSPRGWGLLWFATLAVLQVVAAAVMTQVAPISPFSAGRSQANSYLGFGVEFAVAFGLLVALTALGLWTIEIGMWAVKSSQPWWARLVATPICAAAAGVYAFVCGVTAGFYVGVLVTDRPWSEIPRADFVRAPFGLLALAIGDALLARRHGARLSRAASRGIDPRRLGHAGDGWLTRS